MNAKTFTDGLATQKHPTFSPGDTVSVHIKIKEGEKERIQIFEGIVMEMKGGGNTASFTVRKVSFGVGVERIFPFQCASIEKILVVKQGRVRRAKLFYIRELQGKALRIQDKVDYASDDSSDEKETSSKSKVKKSAKKGDTQEAASAN